ncbi:MAG: YciI family protein [Pirellulaceae bacterium]
MHGQLMNIKLPWRSRSNCHRLHAEGKYISAAPLHPPCTAKCVRVRDGLTTISDGPFAETKEQLGGYFLVEAGDLDDAIAIAARIPGSLRGTAEIRPLFPMYPINLYNFDA